MLIIRHVFSFLICGSLSVSLLAQTDASPDSKNSSAKKKEEHPTRTLRVMIVGSRALPAFETRGDKIVEVDPPLSAMPPTSFAFANPSHAPQIKSKKKGTGRTLKISYSAWANELVRIKNYKGPELLPLHLKRALISTTDYQRVDCHLGKSIHPFIVITDSKGNQGWKKPVAKVIDWNPIKHPANSLLFINNTHLTLRIFLTKKGVVIPPQKHRHFKVSLSQENTFRYKVEASDGKTKIIVTNSQYRMNKNSRLIMVALSGVSTKSTQLPRPTLRITPDAL